VFERPVVARTPIPAAPAGFAAQREQLTSQPGRPLDAASRKELKKPEATVPGPVVKVLAPRGEGQPSLPPPVVAKPDQRRVQPETSKESASPQGKTLSPVAPPGTYNASAGRSWHTWTREQARSEGTSAKASSGQTDGRQAA
jgi:hypothetical protein